MVWIAGKQQSMACVEFHRDKQRTDLSDLDEVNRNDFAVAAGFFQFW
jgi:hypothetical protein